MRARILRKQMVTVRPLIPQTGDVFGDAPVVMPDNRNDSFQMAMQVTWSALSPAGPGRPGRDESKAVTIKALKRDVPPTAPDGWTPTTNDIILLASGESLFITDIQPAYPRRISIRTPNSGWDGWRITATAGQPTMTAATQYE